MTSKILIVAILSFTLGFALETHQTPPGMVATYDSLADAILAVKQTEANFVTALVGGHLHAARSYVAAGEWEQASAQMALFASEGDNAVGGVRKRLLEGGHHHNAAGEAKGLYEPGFVIITRSVKEQALGAAADLRKAGTDMERKMIWERFENLATPLVGKGH